jgi:hypothetical protein
MEVLCRSRKPEINKTSLQPNYLYVRASPSQFADRDRRNGARVAMLLSVAARGGHQRHVYETTYLLIPRLCITTNTLPPPPAPPPTRTPPPPPLLLGHPQAPCTTRSPNRPRWLPFPPRSQRGVSLTRSSGSRYDGEGRLSRARGRRSSRSACRSGAGSRKASPAREQGKARHCIRGRLCDLTRCNLPSSLLPLASLRSPCTRTRLSQTRYTERSQ